MSITFNGNTLNISAKPTDGALIPDKNATNVAGIASIGTDMYCVKTTGLKTTLFKASDYVSTEAISVKENMNWFALGLTKIGSYLYMLAEEHNKYGGTTTIVKMDANGNQLDTYRINDLCPEGALGITAADETDAKFIIMHYTDSNNADSLTFSLVNWKASKAQEVFTVTNSYGYTKRVQDIYYNDSFGLFILTNNDFSTLQNRILVIDYHISENTQDENIQKNYVPSAVISVDKTGDYKQYNLESICMKNSHLVLASNVVKSNGTSEDKFSVLKGITYSGKTYTFACGFKAGARVPTKVDPNYKTTNLGCVCFKDSVPYFVKQSENTVSVLGYCTDYMNTKAKPIPVVTHTDGLLGHANGMTYFNNQFYVVAGDDKIVSLNDTTNKDGTVYTISSNEDNKTLHLKAISYFYKANTVLLMSVENGKMLLYKCDLSNTENLTAIYLGTIENPGQPVRQDIFYHNKYGLFVATTDSNVTGKNITTKNTLLHYDLKKLTAKTILHPDFGFVTNMPATNAEGQIYNSFELESIALDPQTKKLTAVCNANAYKSSTDKTLVSMDGFFQYNTIDFI